jgi:acyl carrier protein
MSLEQTLKTFIEENLMHDDKNRTVGFDEPLIDRGVLDSMGLMNLIGFLEERAGVRVPDEEVLLENFATINAIVATADRLKSAR